MELGRRPDLWQPEVEERDQVTREIYLNTSSYGRCPDAVICARAGWHRFEAKHCGTFEFADCIRFGTVPDAIGTRFSETIRDSLSQIPCLASWHGIDALRNSLAQELNCRGRHVVLGSSTTLVIECVLGSLLAEVSGNVVLSDMEHATTIRAVASATRRNDSLCVRMVKQDEATEPRCFETLEDKIVAACDNSTCCIVLSTHAYLTGLALNIPRVIRRVRSVAPCALVVIDGAQGFGATCVDEAANLCNVFIGSGHKWLEGPIASGFAVADGRAMDAMIQCAEEFFESFGLLSTLQSEVDHGTQPSVGAWVGLQAAIDLIKLNGGFQQRAWRIKELRAELVHYLNEMTDFRVLVQSNEIGETGIVSVSIPETYWKLALDQMDRSHIVARPFDDVKILRLSISPSTTTTSQLLRVAEALAFCKESRRSFSSLS